MKFGPFRLTRGLHTAETSAFLPPGALTAAAGTRLAPDSGRLRRARGRSKFNSAAPSTGFASLVALDFNTAADLLVQFQGTGVYSATVAATGTFAAVANQRSDEAAAATNYTVSTQTLPITATRFGDAYLIADGVSRPTIIENNGRARVLGLLAPKGQLTFADATPGTFIRPNAVATVTSNPGGDAIITHQDEARAYDANQNTAAVLSIVGGDGGLTATYSFAAGAGLTRQLRIILSGNENSRATNFFSYHLYVSTDSGTTYTTIKEGSVNTIGNRTEFPYNVPGTPALETIRVRVTINTPLGIDVFRDESGFINIFDVALATAGTVTPIATDTAKFGIRYAYTKVRKYMVMLPGATEASPFEIESSLSEVSPPSSADGLTFGNASATIVAAVNGLVITRTEAFESDVTSWNIYRSVEGSTNEETLATDAYSKVGSRPADSFTYTDIFTEGGHPLNYQDPQASPPIIIVGAFLYHANDPPPDKTDVVGSFAGSALYASASSPGFWWWSSPVNPDYVPGAYVARSSAAVTAFLDIGVLIIFTAQSVQSTDGLPLASDSDFYPSRRIRDVSKARGCVSRRGACLFEVPGAEILAAFVSSDGLYTTNGAQIALMSRALDWPATISAASLATAELLHSPNERKLILAYDDAAAVRQALDFYYGGEGIAVCGPRRWPDESTATVLRANRVDVYSSQDGIVYLEEQGTADAAALENTDKRITYTVSLPQFYVGEKRRFNTLSIHTPAASGVSLTVTVNTRIDGKAAEPFVTTLDDEFDFDGWKDIGIGRECESFNVTFASTSAAFPGIDAVSFDFEGDSDVIPQRISV